MRAMGIALLIAAAAPVTAADLGVAEAQQWLRHVIPLPQEIALEGALEVPPGAVRIVAPLGGSSVVASAVAELRRVVGRSERPRQATVRLMLGGARAENLRELPSSEQAYRIETHASGREIRIIALEPPGLYYGALTLAQLIRARSTESVVTLPILSVTDWPDIADRGLWGSDNFLEVEWMARRKLNLIQQISWLHVTADGHGEARLKDGREAMVELAPDLAMRPVPAVLHLEQLSGKGLFEAYPQLRAQGGAEGAICYSRPEFVGVLADWLVELGSLRGVETVEVWLAENLHGEGGCQCPECAKHDRSVLEARTVVAAWQQARKRLPGLRLRVMTSEETDGSNRAIIEALPPEVGIDYYHSLLTYTCMRRAMIPPEFAEAANDRWVGVVPNFVALVRPAHPFTGAQFMHQRLTEFTRKGLSGVMGYATPRVKYARFNVEAAAEWAWNADGRASREFALSYAVRHGLPEPELFADWAMTLGEVAWDVYASDWPSGLQRRNPGPAADMLAEGTLPPLGEIKWGVYPAPWGGISDAERLAADVEAAGEAMELAQQLGSPEHLYETQVIQGYIEALAALHALKTLAPGGQIAPQDRDMARASFQRYLSSLQQAEIALRRWALTVDPDEGALFTDPGVTLLREMRQRMRDTAATMGVSEL